MASLREDERLRFLQEGTAKMKKMSALDDNLDLGVIASRTKSYNRPELELLLKLAQGNAFSTQLLKTKGIPTMEGLKLTMDDFTIAMGDVENTIKSKK